VHAIHLHDNREEATVQELIVYNNFWTIHHNYTP
jgi:hypothetical protein